MLYNPSFNHSEIITTDASGIHVYDIKKNTKVPSPDNDDRCTPIVIGGKGYSLTTMTKLKMNVPPAVIVPISHHETYFNSHPSDLDIDLCYSCFEFEEQHIDTHLLKIAKTALSFFENSKINQHDMLFMSVRSGAQVSMPGMMETILNVGMHEGNIDKIVAVYGEEFARNTFRMLFKSFVIGSSKFISGEEFDDILSSHVEDGMSFAEERQAYEDITKELDLEMVNDRVSNLYTLLFNSENAVLNQLMYAQNIVYLSWISDECKTYREANGLELENGTAVIIQEMVFGNQNKSSASGVLFTHNIDNGANEIMGEYLPETQGEAIVSGVSTPRNLHEMKSDPLLSNAYDELIASSIALADDQKDIMDIEFTIQDGVLYFLQCRSAKRTDIANLKYGLHLVDKGINVNSPEYNHLNVSRSIKAILEDKVVPKEGKQPIMEGKPASAGIAVGQVDRFVRPSLDDSASGSKIFLADTTTTDDIEYIQKSAGVLTKVGGVTSHAALVCRALGKPCLTSVKSNYSMISAVDEDCILDANTGNVWLEEDASIVKETQIPVEIASRIEGQPFGIDYDDPILGCVKETQGNMRPIIYLTYSMMTYDGLTMKLLDIVRKTSSRIEMIRDYDDGMELAPLEQMECYSCLNINLFGRNIKDNAMKNALQALKHKMTQEEVSNFSLAIHDGDDVLLFSYDERGRIMETSQASDLSMDKLRSYEDIVLRNM